MCRISLGDSRSRNAHPWVFFETQLRVCCDFRGNKFFSALNFSGSQVFGVHTCTIYKSLPTEKNKVLWNLADPSPLFVNYFSQNTVFLIQTMTFLITFLCYKHYEKWELSLKLKMTAEIHGREISQIPRNSSKGWINLQQFSILLLKILNPANPAFE